MDISVWAPDAHNVYAIVDNRRIALQAKPDGTWHINLAPGTQYFLQLDDSDLKLPDPRSMCQAAGAHGPSTVIDPQSFVFAAHDWVCPDLGGKVFYELHIGTFTPEGTFRSAIERLDDLVALGIDAIELMPINPIPGTRGWGYDSVSLFALNPHYGTAEDLVAFIDSAHTRGIAVCLDIVYNHFGPDGNYLAQFGPYFTHLHHTPWGDGVNFDGHNASHVRQYFIDNALMWVRDYRLDALRLDATDFLIDESSRHIVADISDNIAAYSRQSGRRITLIAENNSNTPRTLAPVGEGGWGMDMQWVDDVHHALHVWLTGEKNAFYIDHADHGTLAKAFTSGMTRTGQHSIFEGKPCGHPVPDHLSGHSFVVFDENHDQVGNRLIGDRPSHSLPLSDVAISRALILLSPFTPMLFMGEEWAATTPFMFFTDHGPEIGPHIKAGREKEFESWDLASVYPAGNTMIDPQDIRAFTLSKLNWSEAESGDHRRLRDFVRELIRLRKENADIASGDRHQTQFVLSPSRSSGWMRRGAILIIFARHANTTVDIPIEEEQVLTSWETVEFHSRQAFFAQPGVIVVNTKS
ncbi:malto-oligosyltrehalose trehalohydrolase [Arcanobacterium buesumense]|uniref:Malto-oligosyltrehalose trehalohydrolase n=1 Tax=Arcanobacterium buesumense TaxID=2722751 RepID=A0A6H2EKJ7_9ACTO|nr:malto-oligosyltrehalose trehalohydrolase [Arcanobacterium buesumense]QJC21714.1 malto-oligosyltrehalose trehalohydrolase [Arcanobacterium buesumense]